MPDYGKLMDVVQGFNFKKDKQSSIGFILSMSVGGTKLKANLETIKNPEKPNENLKAVAVLGHYAWNTGLTDTMYFSGNLTVWNKQQLRMLLLKGLTNVEVVFSYAIYDYDSTAKKYFKSNSHKGELKGMVAKEGSDLNMMVVDTKYDEVQFPTNYIFQIGIKPQPKEQQVTLAEAALLKLEKQWGSTEGK